MRIPTTEDKAYVEVLLDEALADLAKVTDALEYKVLRTTLRDELLFHPSGQALIRAAQEDPTIDVSGKVTKRLQAMTEALKAEAGGTR